MKWLNSAKKRLVLTGFVMVIILAGGGITKADYTFGEPTNLGPKINGPFFDGHPSISSDGLSLFFYSDRSNGHGRRDIWVATRATTDEDWTTAKNVGPPHEHFLSRIGTVHYGRRTDAVLRL
jgi:hypothetical protein